MGKREGSKHKCVKSLTWLVLGRDTACVHDRLVIPLAALKASFGPSHRKSAVAGSAPLRDKQFTAL